MNKYRAILYLFLLHITSKPRTVAKIPTNPTTSVIMYVMFTVNNDLSKSSVMFKILVQIWTTKWYMIVYRKFRSSNLVSKEIWYRNISNSKKVDSNL